MIILSYAEMIGLSLLICVLWTGVFLAMLHLLEKWGMLKREDE